MNRSHTLRRDRVSRASREAIEVAARHVAEDADELVAALASAHAVAVWMRNGELGALRAELERKAPPQPTTKKKRRRR